MQGGIVQPIQQQSWSFVFRSKLPNNIIFSLHPNVDENELGMFFPEEPSFMLERIGSTKAGYPSENKWVGASPAEHLSMTQHQLVAYYTIPANAKYHHIDLFIPKNGDVEFVRGGPTKPSPGWMLLNCNRSTVAIYVSDTAVWFDEGSHYRARIYRDTTMLWMIVGESSGMKAESLKNILHSIPTPSEFGEVFDDPVHKERIRIDLKNPNYYDSAFTKFLYRSPFINSSKNSAVIKLEAGGKKLTLDFIKNEEY